MEQSDRNHLQRIEKKGISFFRINFTFINLKTLKKDKPKVINHV